MVRMDQQKTLAKAGSLEMKYNATASGYIIVMIKHNNEVLYSAVMGARGYGDAIASAEAACNDTLTGGAVEMEFINNFMAYADIHL